MSAIVFLVLAGLGGVMFINYFSYPRVYTMNDLINSIENRGRLNQAAGTESWFVPNQARILEPDSPAFRSQEFYSEYRQMDYINRFGNIFIEPQLDPYVTNAKRQPPAVGGGLRTENKVTANHIPYQKVTDHYDPKNDSYPTSVFNKSA
jgi:hypothetical protein